MSPLHWRDRAAEAIRSVPETTLVFGNGRSYGDSCLAASGHVVDGRGLDRFIGFDESRGVVECEGGVLLGDILDRVVPKGWFLPVVPGTQFVTVAGAIANDIHGKNQHRRGTFGNHVESLTLVRSDGEQISCSATERTDWLSATVGGLGLTGVITRARISLVPIRSGWMDVETIRFGSLSDFYSLSAESANEWEYTVAWVDTLARGEKLGRGHFLRGRHLPDPEARPLPGGARLTVPFQMPFSLVNRLTMWGFTRLYYHRLMRERVRRRVAYAGFFFPLDGVLHWNRVYGPRGFQQYQCVVPPEEARPVVAEMLRLAASRGPGSFLSVLKEFGPMPSVGLLSFARPGTTLAIDFPAGHRTDRLLPELDSIVQGVNGAVYPAKDARMSAEMFSQSFPAWRDLERYRDPKLKSSFWERVSGGS